MASLEQAIRKKYRSVIAMTDVNEVNNALRRIAGEAGLGVAILVAWQHGLRIEHIPLKRDTDGNVVEPQARVIGATERCPYVFVHVPVRWVRNDKPKLVELGIMNQDADPASFIYHEDGLIGTFSFLDPASAGLTEEDIREILDTLAQQGVLMRANIENRQIQFKDLAAKRRIEGSREKVYVRVENQPLDKGRLPVEFMGEDVWDYVVRMLENKSACNYCSVQAFTPREVTIHSAHVLSHAERRKYDLSTVRNYQLGFTYAPFGDPREACHFLAWDFPHVNDLVMNMEPQVYSFSDLIRMVRSVNRDIREFCGGKVDPLPEPISGICNHWAGNSLYHQHYQFARLPGLPLMRGLDDARTIVTYKDVVEVRKFTGWPAPAFLITSTEPGWDEDVMRVADRLTREWRMLSDGDDRSYGNGISIRHHTQNIFVTVTGDRLTAVFIPRDRRKIGTSSPRNMFQKRNVGTLEMMGYFIIDNPADFERLTELSTTSDDRKALGDSWLSELAPDAAAIRDLEANIGICLSEAVAAREEQIDETLGEAGEDLKQEAWILASSIQRDESLDSLQREHLYRELMSAILELGP